MFSQSVNVNTVSVMPSGRIELGMSGMEPDHLRWRRLQATNFPRAVLLNRVAKYSAIVGGVIGSIGIAGLVAALTLDMGDREKLELGAATAGFLFGGFLCCGITNCLYCCGLSSSSDEANMMEDEWRRTRPAMSA